MEICSDALCHLFESRIVPRAEIASAKPTLPAWLRSRIFRRCLLGGLGQEVLQRPYFGLLYLAWAARSAARDIDELAAVRVDA